MVEAEPEQACHGLRPGACLRREPCVAKRGCDAAGRVAEAEEADEGGVELADGDGASGHGDRVAVNDGLDRGERQRLERGGERALGQWLLRLEVSARVGQEAGRDDGLDLRLRPGAVGRVGVRDESEQEQAMRTSGRMRLVSAASAADLKAWLRARPPPQPYDFAVSTARFDVYGLDRATVWHDGGIHRVFGGRELRIEAAPGGVDVSPSRRVDRAAGPALPRPALRPPRLLRLGGRRADTRPARSTRSPAFGRRCR